MGAELGDLVVELAGQRRAACRGVCEEPPVEDAQSCSHRQGSVLWQGREHRAERLGRAFHLVLIEEGGGQVALGLVKVVSASPPEAALPCSYPACTYVPPAS